MDFSSNVFFYPRIFFLSAQLLLPSLGTVACIICWQFTPNEMKANSRSVRCCQWSIWRKAQLIALLLSFFYSSVSLSLHTLLYLGQGSWLGREIHWNQGIPGIIHSWKGAQCESVGSCLLSLVVFISLSNNLIAASFLFAPFHVKAQWGLIWTFFPKCGVF